MNKILLYPIFFLFLISGYSQSILLDEEFDDWKSDDILMTKDVVNDNIGSSFDIISLGLASSKDYLFVNFELGEEINLQNYNKLRLYIDTDNDLNTGNKVNGIGSDLEYWFGEKKGYLTTNGIRYSIGHGDIGMMILPTVSSNQFELLIDRKMKFGGHSIFPNSSIKVVIKDDRSNGDKIPNSNGGVSYQMNDNQTVLPEYKLKRPNTTDIRIMSYNVLRDDMFDYSKKSAYEHIFKAIQPDIIGFEEIYGHSAKQTKTAVQDFLDNTSTQWYYEKSSPDIICLSKYPILATKKLDGNAAFRIKYNQKDLVFIIAHLPCCDNNTDRNSEIDRIMSFVRDIKEGNSGWELDAMTPIIIVGDMNLVGYSSQQKSFTTGDIHNENQFGDDFAPDWDDTNFEDAKPVTTGSPSTITWYEEQNKYNPGRLDYIFYSGSVLELENSFSLFTPKLQLDSLDYYGFEHDDTSWASDHIPVVADFRLKDFNATDIVKFNKTIKLSPIPASNKLAIEFDDKISSKYDIKIYDINGHLVLHEANINPMPSNQTSINISNLPTGVYNLTAISQGQIYTRKFVITK